jgi:hypothetical protein
VRLSRSQSKSSSTTGARKSGSSKAPAGCKWIIDISQPVSDKVRAAVTRLTAGRLMLASQIMDPAAFEKFLQDKIKVDGGKAGQLGDKVKITREGDQRIVVTTTGPFSKVASRPYLPTPQLIEAIFLALPQISHQEAPEADRHS